LIVLGNVVINEEPEYLLVLYLTKKGDVYEVLTDAGKPHGNQKEVGE